MISDISKVRVGATEVLGFEFIYYIPLVGSSTLVPRQSDLDKLHSDLMGTILHPS